MAADPRQNENVEDLNREDIMGRSDDEEFEDIEEADDFDDFEDDNRGLEVE